MDVDFNDDVEVVDLENQEVESSDDDNYGQIQDRMSGDAEPWYSESEGAVVDVDGNPLKDEHGNRFENLDAYHKTQTQSQTTAKQESPDAQNSAPKTFIDFISEQMTPERIETLSKKNSFKYNDEFLPKIATQQVLKAGMPPPDAVTIDPVVKVKNMHKTWTNIAVDPVRQAKGNMYNALVQNGADMSVATQIVNQVFDPVLSKQSESVENLYRDEYEKAVESKMDSKYSDYFNEIDNKKLVDASDNNINELSKTYFDENGKDFFYGMINGYLKDPNDKTSFQRGPAAHLFDWFSHMMNGGKEYASEQERNKAMDNTLRKLTADRTQANLLFDTMYYYWIGKNAASAQKVSFESGKKAAKNEQQRVQKTVRKRPTTAQQPQGGDPFDGYPDVLRSALLFNQ